MTIYAYNLNYYYNKKQPVFTANMRQIVNVNTGNKYWTTTYLFRDDLDWQKFADLLKKKYEDIKQVNILNHACSNGLEPMSLVMLFLTNFGFGSEKFFPIIAKDKNVKNIAMAKSYEAIEVDNYDYLRLNNYTNESISSFFYSLGPTSKDSIDTLRPKEIFRNKIKYSEGDILDDIKNLPDKNNVVLFRNSWLYLNPGQQEDLAKQLSEKLDSTSLVVIGFFDNKNSKASELLNKYGFRETDVEFVYEKSNKPTEQKTIVQDAKLYPATSNFLQKKYGNNIVELEKI